MFIRVLLADDSRIMRDAIRSFLSGHSEIALVGEAVDFSQTIGMVCDLSRWTGLVAWSTMN
jgi:chemotaxis response regulator CheB